MCVEETPRHVPCGSHMDPVGARAAPPGGAVGQWPDSSMCPAAQFLKRGGTLWSLSRTPARCHLDRQWNQFGAQFRSSFAPFHGSEIDQARGLKPIRVGAPGRTRFGTHKDRLPSGTPGKVHKGLGWLD